MTRAILRILAFFALFFGGYDQALPDYGIGVRIVLAYGVFLGNVMLVAYALLYFSAGGIRTLTALRDRRVVIYASLVFALGGLGMVSAGFNATSALDFGQGGRLMLYAALFVFAVQWSREWGAFALRAYLIGIGVGGALNVYYTLTAPSLVVFDVLPVLYSSNGAGGMLAIAIGLSAWLWMLRSSPWDARVAVAVASIGCIAVALSFSKTAMLIGFLGICSWLSVMARKAARRFLRNAVLAGCAALVLIVTVRPRNIDPGAIADLLVRAVTVKFGNMTLESKFGIDAYNVTGSRFAYWPMTFRVLVEHPLLGVGYSGLYDAYSAARKGYEDIALAEVQGSRATNPHNSFLYYVASNGFFGMVLVTTIFAASLRLMLRACARYRLPGRLLWLTLASAYLVYGFTLPTLFNTEVLYLPAAVAAAFARMPVGARATTAVRALHGRPVALPSC
jgi:O-antigen ligase